MIGCSGLSAQESGEWMYELMRRLQPIPRSITGPGLRRFLAEVAHCIPLEVRDVPSGARALDWTIPPEWRLNEAWIEGPNGERVVDAAASDLHLVGYSEPIDARMSLAELAPHLHTIPEHPGWVPYRTSYYTQDWGFCLRHSDFLGLVPGEYRVRIDTELDPDGVLNYGELFLPGEDPSEVLISCHCCHPWMCNDNLSGVVVAVRLAMELARQPRKRSYRFLFVPGTIGSLAWLAQNCDAPRRVAHGLVLAGVGTAAGFTYKRSRRGSTIDRVAALALRDMMVEHDIIDFEPYGYDERQYCSPGFDLPAGCLMRSKHGTYPEYHTSADDLQFVHAERLGETLDVCLAIVAVLEGNDRLQSTAPFGEPQLGRRGLYRALGGLADAGAAEMAMLWVLSYSDGAHDLVDIAERSGLAFPAVRRAADALLENGLLAPAMPAGTPA